jgi:hypothetical protein
MTAPDLDTLPVEAGEDAWAAWEGRTQPRASRRERRAQARAEREALGPQPGPRGWRGPGQGEDLVLPAISEFRGPSSQLCGVWPFVVGAGAPIIGAPAGRHLITGGTVCCDEVAWYQRAHLISAPIMLVLAKLGLGKALDVDTPIPTPDGVTRMGDLRPGDYVIGGDGRPTPVIAVSGVMTDRECWELEFSTGERIVADADHLWVTETSRDRSRANIDRIKPPKRQPLGSHAELTRAAILAAEPTGPVRVREVSQLMGWERLSNRESLLYSWAKDLTPVAPRRYDRRELLTLLGERLARVRGDQRSRIANTGPITTRQIAATLTLEGKTNHTIPVMPGLDLPDRDLPIPPYAIGAWLGDGTASAATLTCYDPEIVDNIRASGIDVTATGTPMRWQLTVPGTRRRKLDGFQPRLRALGVLNNKHIPTEYLRASEQQRRALLAGLLDTDGTVSPAGGQIQYTSTNRRLAEDVLELVASLGYRPGMRQGTARIRGKDCGPMFTIGFTTVDPVFGLPRKMAAQAARVAGNGTRTRARSIVGARRVVSRPVQCIQVGADDGLFQVGRSFITTHNSSLVRHKLLGQYAMGILPMIFGDLRPDYVDLIRAIGGQVLTLGPGAGALNVLDPGEAHEAARRLTGSLREQVLADAHTRRQVGVSSLVTIARDGQPTDREESVLDRALRVLDDNTDHRRAAPILADLLQVIRDAPEDVRAAALDRGERHRYDLIVENLEASLVALIGGGRLGDTFSRPTTEPMRRDRPVCFDVSRLRKGSTPAARAATLITCWNYGFGAIDTANALADAGLEHRRLYSATMDELWEVLRVGHGMPGRVDALARTNRANGVGITMISHSAADTRTLADPADREMARLLMEKAGVVVLGGLPEGEMPMLEQLVGLSRVEQTMLTGWTDPAAWDPVTGAETDPPGRGNFLIKVGGKPGIPVHVELTEVERRLGVHNTARLWEHVSRIGRITDLPEGGQVRQLRRPPVPQMSAGDAG